MDSLTNPQFFQPANSFDSLFFGKDYDPFVTESRASGLALHQPELNPIGAIAANNTITLDGNEGLKFGGQANLFLDNKQSDLGNQNSSSNILGNVIAPTNDAIANFSDYKVDKQFSAVVPSPSSAANTGVYTVDANGKVIVDFLADGGGYQSQMALFSLKGMENLQPGSTEFIQEAARRALSSTEGYVVIQDDKEGAKFNLKSDRDNDGAYTGRKVYNFQPGDRVAMMLVPNGSVEDLLIHPNAGGDKRPLFSIAAANPKGFDQIAQIGNNVFGWEDKRQDVRGSDRDFNDILFQIKGITGETPNLGDIKKANDNWQKGSDYRQMMNYAKKYLAPDTEAPELNLKLVRDTGSSNTDLITNNPTIAGRVKDKGDIVELFAQFQGSANSRDILNLVGANGKFKLDRATLETIYGGTLQDGNYRLNLTATDDRGNASTQTLNFTLDTTAPTATLDLVASSDSGTVGDRRTNITHVDLTGKTDPFASLVINLNPSDSNSSASVIRTTADGNGNYTLSGVDLAFGLNNFTIHATDAAGNTSTTEQQIRRIAQDDVVIFWDRVLLDAIKTDKTAPPMASRNMAIVGTAVYDAVNNIEQKFTSYLVDKDAPIGASAEAAAASAAYRALVELYPNQKATFDAALTQSLATITDGKAEDDGVAFGQEVASMILAARANDLAYTGGTYTAGTQPGEWRPTPDSNAPALLPKWGIVQPFAIDAVANFTPPPPPSLTSDVYAQELNQTKEYGSINSTVRTADQTEIAKFWADGAGTYTPPGHWNEIALNVALDRGNNLLDNARMFAMLNMSVADAGIVCWDCKYNYDFWRPITAIREADTDGNPNTTADPNWTPLIKTPPFPEYTSGHSTFSGAASAVLSHLYGDDYSFSTTSIGLPGVTRNFTSFSQAADEAGISRIYGGIHFMSANLNGLECGEKIGNYVSTNFFTPI
jgi:hypothetical protein